MTRQSDSPRHVCIVLLSGLGDVVHGLPVVNALRDANPRLRITWVVEPTAAPLLRGHPSVDQVIVYKRNEGIAGVRALWNDLRMAPPIDTTLNFNVYFKSVWPTLLSRAPRRIGFDRERTFEGVWLASNDRIQARPRAHTADMFLEFAKHLEVATDNPEWRLELTNDELRDQKEFFSRFRGKPVATIIPASASHKKDWLTERWCEVAEALGGDFGYRVLIAGGPGEREQAIGREIIAASSWPVEWAMGDSVRQLAWILAGSQLVIAPDTGPVHIARAFNIPVIGIYGHTNPWRVGPWRAFEDLWVDRYTEGLPDASNRTPKWDVMETITTADVLEKVQLVVSR